jgi:hypothetical protein
MAATAIWETARSKSTSRLSIDMGATNYFEMMPSNPVDIWSLGEPLSDGRHWRGLAQRLIIWPP